MLLMVKELLIFSRVIAALDQLKVLNTRLSDPAVEVQNV